MTYQYMIQDELDLIEPIQKDFTNRKPMNDPVTITITLEMDRPQYIKALKKYKVHPSSKIFEYVAKIFK